MRIALAAALVVVVVCLIGIGSAASSVGPALQGTPAPFTNPTLPPSPTPVCAQVPLTRLIVYERGRVTSDDPSPLNMREGPNTSFPILDSLAASTVFFVLEGPECSQRYAWYRIRVGDLEGWVAEGSVDGYFVEPYLPG